jgi:hypothetical protein
MTDSDAANEAFAQRMIREAQALRATAEAAWLPAVRGQLMSRVAELENAATLAPPKR